MRICSYLKPLVFLTFLGRLHPMVVHFPIALIVVAFLMEMISTRPGKEGLRPGANMLTMLGAVSAIVAVAMGLVLHESETYGGELIEYHEWTGILTMVLAIIAAGLLMRIKRRNTGRNTYRIVLGISVIALTIAGHLGASITHGEDYLTSAFDRESGRRSNNQTRQLLTEYQAIKVSETFSEEQLDRLNLEVRAIFAHNCYQCHSREKQKGELILQTEEGVMVGGENGPILVPGDAANSEIIRRLTLPRDHKESMPPKGKTLQKDEIELISLWIDQGAHWADAELKVFREAELALNTPEIPPADGDISHPVDRFINQYFQQTRQQWPEIVNDRIFARRAYMDIIGLLPTPGQLTAFQEDESPDKRKKLVDQLFSDEENYTQHWLTFWNDLLRNDYSGTGFITGGRRQITDWLYKSLKENKPYDQMVEELVNPTEESEGFIRGIKWRGEVNSSQRTEMQAAQNISQSLMGLNLKCASCHDSFISNLTLDQSYAFANIFADSTLEIHRCDKPTGRMARTGFIYPELGDIQAETIKARLEELSVAMVKPENGRLYRTIVNRLWAELMGRGIVSPVDEMDRIPWNQDLLDWLAADLIASNYDLRQTLKTIITSRAYQLPSVGYASVNDLITEDFTFTGPIRRRLSAEQFADAFSQAITPMYHSVAFDPGGERLEAQWIWHRQIEVDRDVLPHPGMRYFRYVFELPAGKSWEKAQLLATADHAFTLYLNEQRVAAGSIWWKVEKEEVGSYLKAGKNIIAVEGENDGEIPNPAGLLMSLQVRYPDSSTVRVYSHSEWKSTDSLSEGKWYSLEYDDSEWAQTRRYAGFYNTKWGRLPEFTHQEKISGTPVRASMVMLDPFMKALGRPTRENVTTVRDDRATLLQALELTNGDFFTQTIQYAASRWIEDSGGNNETIIREIYQRALGRAPTSKELSTAKKLIGEDLSQAGVEDFIWTVVMLPEFQLIY